jgi:hypothetical protein
MCLVHACTIEGRNAQYNDVHNDAPAPGSAPAKETSPVALHADRGSSVLGNLPSRAGLMRRGSGSATRILAASPPSHDGLDVCLCTAWVRERYARAARAIQAWTSHQREVRGDNRVASFSLHSLLKRVRGLGAACCSRQRARPRKRQLSSQPGVLDAGTGVVDPVQGGVGSDSRLPLRVGPESHSVKPSLLQTLMRFLRRLIPFARRGEAPARGRNAALGLVTDIKAHPRIMIQIREAPKALAGRASGEQDRGSALK